MLQIVERSFVETLLNSGPLARCPETLAQLHRSNGRQKIGTLPKWYVKFRGLLTNSHIIRAASLQEAVEKANRNLLKWYAKDCKEHFAYMWDCFMEWDQGAEAKPDHRCGWLMEYQPDEHAAAWRSSVR